MIPEFLNNKLKKQYKDDYEKIINGYNTKRISSIRINTLKSNYEEVTNFLDENNIKYENISFCDFALLIYNDETLIRNSNLYTEGKIYFQSLSSMIPPIVVEPNSNELILDMTAAPGGKTTELAALSNNAAMITATEKNKIRSERLQYNINKQGAKKVSVINVDARNLDEYFKFDKIMLDAPCSGSGTLNINDMNNFNEELVNRSIKFQKELILSAINHLNKNGEIIYSTCSILKEENEEIIKFALNTKEVELIPITNLDVEKIPQLPSEFKETITVCPTEQYEGFFVAKLKKL